MKNQSDIDRQLWMRRFHPASPGAPRLLCLPHAGGSASFYYPLSAALAPAVDVVVVQYPGRQDRRLEPVPESLESLVDDVYRALGPEADVPLALFGHSMGAVIGFELCRRLEIAGCPPAVFFASGRRGPSVVRAESVHKRDDAGLIAEIKSLDGTDLALVEDEHVLEMIMPALRADYRLIETYRYRPGAWLSCLIVAMVGDADPRVSVEEAQSWAQETSAAFELQVYPGGHFYLTSQQPAVIDQLRAYLRRLSSRPEDRE